MKASSTYKSKGQQGFTLVELVVVTAILGVLSAIAVPFIASHLGESKDRAYEVDRERFQLAVDSFYSRQVNLHFMGKSQYPIMGMAKTNRTFIPADHDHVDEDHVNHDVDHGTADPPDHTVILTELGNPLGGTQGGRPRWVDGPLPESNGIRDGVEEELLDNDETSLDKPGWHVATVDRQGTRYIVDNRDYFIDFTKLVSLGLMVEVPASASLDNKPKDPPGRFALLGANDAPSGLAITPPTSPAGVALWVVDVSSNEVFQYSLEGEPLLDGGFSLTGGNDNAKGITTDGSSFWVLDRTAKMVYRYDLDGTFQDSFPVDNDFGNLEGITTDGTSLWVLDQNDGVFRFSTDGTFQNESFELDSENNNAEGITTDGTSLWVVDDSGGTGQSKVFRYTLRGELRGSFSVAPAGPPQGIATDGANIWVVDTDSDQIYPFGLDGGPPEPVTGVYTGSYSWYVDPDGKVKSLFFYLPEPGSTGFQTAYP